MYFSIVPVDQKVLHGQIYRGPSFLKWRFGGGYDWKWSMNCFGSLSPIAVVATSRRLPVRDEDLRSWGIETRWIEKAQNPREKIHRLLGMVFSMQAGIDRPDLWLGRDIHLGATGKLPAYDKKMQWQEQEASLPRFGEWVWRGRYWVSEITGRVLPVFTGGALPATDAFTAADGTALTTYSASWTYNNGVFLINTNAVHSNSAATETGAHWNADAFNNDQYAKITASAVSGGTLIGVSVRCHASAASWYEHYGDTTATYMAELAAGAWSQKGSDGPALSATHVYELQITGTTLDPRRDGTTTSIGTQTDASLASGSGGIAGYGSSTGTRGDSWEGGDLSAAGRTTKNTDAQPLGVFAGVSRRTTNTP